MDKHWVWLTGRKGIGARGCAALLRLFGTAERIYALTAQECSEVEGFERKWLPSLMDKDLSQAQRILAECREKSVKLLPYADAAYPERLRNIADPPALLYYLGTLPDFDNEAAIAIVGTRRCSNYGMLQTKQLARQIAASGALVVSGGARGIDSMALRAAMESNMPVACVFGCGVDVAYPRENEALFRDIILRGGCILSEYPPGTPPERGNFPARNRIMSGLSLGVLVVEAPAHSGALITADFALEQGRDVYAIPGNLGAKNSEGTNRLLREGAQFITDGWDLLSTYCYRFPDRLADARKKENMEYIWRMRCGSAPALASPTRMQEPCDKKSVDILSGKLYSDEKEAPQGAAPANDAPLGGDERLLLERMPLEPIYIDELVALSGLSAARVSAALMLLQLKKLVRKQGSNFYQRI